MSRGLGNGMIGIKIKSDHHATLCSLERKRDCVSTLKRITVSDEHAIQRMHPPAPCILRAVRQVKRIS